MYFIIVLLWLSDDYFKMNQANPQTNKKRNETVTSAVILTLG